MRNVRLDEAQIGIKIAGRNINNLRYADDSATANLSYQEASISLLSFSIRGQTDWKPQSQKTNLTDHMDHSLV